MRRRSESPSSFSCYISCPKRYEFKYVHKLPDPSGPAAEFGTMFHEAAYASWHTQSAEHHDPQISLMLQAMYSNPEVQQLPHDKLIKGKTCEYKLAAEAPNQTLFGYVDMILDPIETAVDFKTSSRPWTEEKVHQNIQHIAYPYGLRKIGRSAVKNFLYIVVGSKAKHPVCQVISVTVSDDIINSFEEKFVKTVNRIELDMFPATPSEDACRWCPYKNVCPAFNSNSPNYNGR